MPPTIDDISDAAFGNAEGDSLESAVSSREDEGVVVLTSESECSSACDGGTRSTLLSRACLTNIWRVCLDYAFSLFTPQQQCSQVVRLWVDSPLSTVLGTSTGVRPLRQKSPGFAGERASASASRRGLFGSGRHGGPVEQRVLAAHAVAARERKRRLAALDGR
jgi:hypothetical protein